MPWECLRCHPHRNIPKNTHIPREKTAGFPCSRFVSLILFALCCWTAPTVLYSNTVPLITLWDTSNSAYRPINTLFISGLLISAVSRANRFSSTTATFSTATREKSGEQMHISRCFGEEDAVGGSENRPLLKVRWRRRGRRKKSWAKAHRSMG